MRVPAYDNDRLAWGPAERRPELPRSALRWLRARLGTDIAATPTVPAAPTTEPNSSRCRWVIAGASAASGNTIAAIAAEIETTTQEMFVATE